MPNREHVILDIEFTTIIKIVVVLAVFFFIYILKDVVFIIFTSIIISSAITPFADWFETKRIPRIPSVLILYVVFFALLGFFLSLIIPIISFELSHLLGSLPELLSRFSNALSSRTELSQVQTAVNNLSNLSQLSNDSYLNLVINVFGGFFSFVIIVVISFYFSIMKQGVSGFIRSILPGKYESYVISLWKRAENKVGRWVQGQLLLALSVGLVVFIGLSLFHVKYALLLSILAVIFELIPFAGPVLAALPALLVAFNMSLHLGVWVLIFYIIVQQVENHILVPLILGKSLGLNPVTVIISLLIGVKLGGILGALLAVPVAVIIVEIFEDITRQKEVSPTGGR